MEEINLNNENENILLKKDLKLIKNKMNDINSNINEIKNIVISLKDILPNNKDRNTNNNIELKESQSINKNSEYKCSLNNELNPFIKDSSEMKNIEHLYI